MKWSRSSPSMARPTLVRGVIVDISSLKRAEVESAASANTRLAESERRLSGILDTAAVGIVTVGDSAGRIISFNREAERIFGYDAGTMIGATLDRLIPPAQIHDHQQHLRQFLNAAPDACDPAHGASENRGMGDWRNVTGITASGRIVPSATILSRVDVAGKVNHDRHHPRHDRGAKGRRRTAAIAG